MTNVQLVSSGIATGLFAGTSLFVWGAYGDQVTLAYLAGMVMQCF